MSRWPLASGFAKGYILIFRGSPLLIQLFLIYYGLGQFGVIRHSFLAAAARTLYLRRSCAGALYGGLYRGNSARRVAGDTAGPD